MERHHNRVCKTALINSDSRWKKRCHFDCFLFFVIVVFKRALPTLYRLNLNTEEYEDITII